MVSIAGKPRAFAVAKSSGPRAHKHAERPPSFAGGAKPANSPKPQTGGVLNRLRKQWLLPMALLAGITPLVAACDQTPEQMAVEYNNMLATQGAEPAFAFLRAKILDRNSTSPMRAWALTQAALIPGHHPEKVLWTVQVLRLSDPDLQGAVEHAKRTALLVSEDDTLPEQTRSLLKRLVENYPQVNPGSAFGRGRVPARREPFSEAYRKLEQETLLSVGPIPADAVRR